MQSKTGGKSAGRVQSVALKLIVDREREIEAFIPEEYFEIEAHFNDFDAKLDTYNHKKIEIKKEIEAKEILSKLSNAFKIESVEKKEKAKKSKFPFTTSTLQQEAFKALNFNIQKTMRIAQHLYEEGIITYLRTDSVRISDEAKAAAASFITENYGEDFLNPEASRSKSTGSKIQDAHEAIRPADINKTPTDMKSILSRDDFRLYQLIWKRFAASQMKAATYETTSVKIKAGDYRFSTTSSKRIFDGFMLIYTSADDADESEAKALSINKDSVLSFKEFDEKQHFTQPPAHFTEASLVHTLEELGIGRPSTYSPIITTIQKRRYIAKEGKSIFVTELGEVVNDIMKESFPSIVDEKFTATMEGLLDSVEEGTVEWKSVISNFYPDLEASVSKAEKELEKVEIRDEETDIECENCGRFMVIKYGPHGKFLACPGFPECRNTKPYLEKIDVKCPKCNKDIVIRKTKKGRRFYGCEEYPECDFMSWQKPVQKPCPNCGNFMVEKGNKLVCSDNSCGYSEDNKNN